MSVCACGSSHSLIFSCSGAADVGELADAAARKLNRDKVGSMFCLAGIGGRVSGIVATTESADRILVIDGCPLNCARKTLEEAKINNFVHLQLADMGFAKGKSPATAESVEAVCKKATEMIPGCPA